MVAFEILVSKLHPKWILLDFNNNKVAENFKYADINNFNPLLLK